MGLFRRKDERAIPEPGTPEFDQAVEGSALPDDSGGQSVSMGEPGWTEPRKVPEPAEEAPKDPRYRSALLRVLSGKVPNSEGIGGGINPKPPPSDGS
jgi:hypothetical protein